MEVQRVAHCPVVDQRDVEGVADVSAQDRAGSVPVEGPRLAGQCVGDVGRLFGDRERVVALGLACGGRQDRVARGDRRRVVRQRGRGCGAGGGVLAVVVACVARVAARGRGPRRGGGAGGRGTRGYARGLHVQGHTHLAVSGQGAPALDVAGDDAEVQFFRLAGRQRPGGHARLKRQVVALIPRVREVDDEAVADRNLDVVGREGHALDAHRHAGRVPGRRHGRGRGRGPRARALRRWRGGVRQEDRQRERHDGDDADDRARRAAHGRVVARRAHAQLRRFLRRGALRGGRLRVLASRRR